MEKQFTYFLILALSLMGPLALSFDKKVGFWKKWKYLFPAMLLPAILYMAWDMYFTRQQVWSFNPDYYVAALKVYNLPLEEVLFFFVVPYCCMFIYECIRVYFPGLKGKRHDDMILKSMAVLLLVTGLVFRERMYTSWTFILLALYIGLIYLNRSFFRQFDATSFIIAYSIVLIPFLVVNGYLTSIPIVLYNNEQNLDIRILTIPMEDVFYGMLLMLMNVTIFEKLRTKKKVRNRQRSAGSHSINGITD